ncbi:MAG TPA: PKD domain-containing protein, partial [Bacteroidales bacterium]|nr:PKD domain-containing protein [Bacteroidales bacterium]
VVNLVTNEIMSNIKTEILDVSDVEQAYISGPYEAYTGQRVTFSAGSTYLPGWDIELFYWNFDDETAAVGKEIEKSFLRPGTYNIQLIVTAKPEEGGMARETCVTRTVIITERP